MAFATLVLYPTPEPVKPKSKPIKVVHQEFSANKIAVSLVGHFFNGSEDDKAAEVSALENTINHLNTNTAEDTNMILSDLKNNNLSAVIQSLTSKANNQKTPQESAKLWVHIGNIQNLTSTKQALQAYIKASTQDPDNSNAWNRQGHIHRQLKHFDKAESAFKKVKALDSQSTTNQALYLANLGLLSQTKGDMKAAEESFLEALEIYSTFDNDAGILSTSENLANLYKKTKKYKKSETHYLIALKIHQKNEQTKAAVTAYSALASLYQTMEKNDKAQIQYEKALEISINNNFEKQLAGLYNNLGTLAKKNGQPEISKGYFEKALLLDTGIDSNAKRTIATANQLANLATINRKKKKYEESEKLYLKAIEIYAENKNVDGINSQKINLGFLYKVWGKPLKSCEIWRSSLSLLHKSKNKRLAQIQQLIRTTCP
ncbi:MAG: tetratricopeptide repeat protein [Cocleimonas sp.]|nr:tetratricopeptide repeat protein [Cocleimonas sp.]